MQWPGVEDSRSGNRLTAERPVKMAAVVALLALTVLDRFGLRWGELYTAHPAMLAMYGLLAVVLLTGAAELNARGSVSYAIVAAIGALSYLVNANFGVSQHVSAGSWLLVLTLYLPFVFSLRKDAVGTSLWPWVVNLYVSFALFIAVAGIAQFLVQFIYRPAWLFDYTPLIPAPIRGFEVWKGVHLVGEWYKSNGFFLREPSFLSLHMGFAMLCELCLARRRWVMAVLGLALLLSYSGSGLLVLAVALLFPLGRHSLLRFAAVGAAAALLFYLFGDALQLNYTVGRVGELSADTSSAYCRFIHPAVVTVQDFDANPWTSLLGHGPGTLHKMYDTCETTFAKVPFEYGLLGTLAFGMLALAALGRPSVPSRIRAGLAVQWLTQPYLLGAEWVLLAYLLCAMWPQVQAAASARAP